jgi:hypothetical protein
MRALPMAPTSSLDKPCRELLEHAYPASETPESKRALAGHPEDTPYKYQKDERKLVPNAPELYAAILRKDKSGHQLQAHPDCRQDDEKRLRNIFLLRSCG